MRNAAYLIKLLLPGVLVFGLTACSGGGTDGGGVSSSDESGQLTLIDAPIAGVTYTCPDGNTSLTDDQGVITCEAYPITFQIGNVVIGQLTAAGPDLFVTPQDLLGIARSQLDDETLMRLIVFLQSLDDDGSYADRINITGEVRAKLTENPAVPTAFEDLNASALAAIYWDLNVTPVSDPAAMAHLTDSLVSYIDTCDFISDYNVSVPMNQSAQFIVYELGYNLNQSVSEAGHGTAAIYAVANEFLSVTYAPDANFSGVDRFDYTVDGCTKQITVNVIADVTAIPSEERHYGAAFFPDDTGTCRSVVTDGNSTFYGVSDGGARCAYDNLYGTFANSLYKVNNRFVFNTTSDNLVAIGRTGSEQWLNDDDISGVKAPFSPCPGDVASMHQIQALLEWALVVKPQFPGDTEHLIYRALSPENTTEPEKDGMAAGMLPWMTDGYKREIIYGSPDAICTVPDGGCCISYYQGNIATFLMRDIAGDGIGSDKVVSPYAEMDGHVYYLTHYDSRLKIDRITPQWQNGLTLGFLFNRGDGTDWVPLTVDSESLYASFSYQSAIASDDKVYFYYMKDGEDYLLESDATADGTRVISTALREVTFQKIRKLVQTTEVVNGSPVLVSAYRDQIYYRGYNTDNNVFEIGKINSDGSLQSIISGFALTNVVGSRWALFDTDKIYYLNGANLYYWNGSESSMVTAADLGLYTDSDGDKSTISAIKKSGDRLYVMTRLNYIDAINLYGIDAEGTVSAIEAGYVWQTNGWSSDFVGTQKMTVFANSTGSDSILYSTVDGNSTLGYTYHLKEYNAIGDTKKVIKTVVTPGT